MITGEPLNEWESSHDGFSKFSARWHCLGCQALSALFRQVLVTEVAVWSPSNDINKESNDTGDKLHGTIFLILQHSACELSHRRGKR